MKIAYTDFWGDFNPQNFPISRIMRNQPNVQEVKDLKKADYLLYSCMGSRHWFAPDNVIKIYFTGEMITPDFNGCDYAIGFDRLDFGDRYLRFPLFYLYNDICELMESKHLQPIEKIMTVKDKFCSITVSNAQRNPIFMTLYEKLSSYQHVDSGGKWNNNIGGPVPDKLEFDKSHKFSIVCENSAYPGYTTEKIVQAFAAHCIPIYWGDPTIGDVFNKKAFICVQDFESLDDVVAKVKEIDQDESLYHKMLLEPALTDERYSKDKQIKKLENFIQGIFAVPLEQAKRRNRDCQGEIYVNERRYQTEVSNSTGLISMIKRILAKI